MASFALLVVEPSLQEGRLSTRSSAKLATGRGRTARFDHNEREVFRSWCQQPDVISDALQRSIALRAKSELGDALGQAAVGRARGNVVHAACGPQGGRMRIVLDPPSGSARQHGSATWAGLCTVT